MSCVNPPADAPGQPLPLDKSPECARITQRLASLTLSAQFNELLPFPPDASLLSRQDAWTWDWYQQAVAMLGGWPSWLWESGHPLQAYSTGV